MPSIGSISATLDRSRHLQEKVGPNSVLFPLIDPLDAYYLLNPSGDLSSTEIAFGRWFRDQNLEVYIILYSIVAYSIISCKCLLAQFVPYNTVWMRTMPYTY